MEQKKSPSASRLDVIVNRSNLASARFQRIQQPWFTSSDNESKNNQEDEDDIGQFQGESELTGLKAINASGDDDALSILQRTRTSTKDRLLTQLLGKHGAQAHLKKQQSQKKAPLASNVSKVIPNSAPVGENDQKSDSESDGGRAATILRKKKPNQPAKPTKQSAIDDQDDTVKSIDTVDQTRHDKKTTSEASKHEKGKSSSTKRKANSYLDELLAQRSSKKNKNKR